MKYVPVVALVFVALACGTMTQEGSNAASKPGFELKSFRKTSDNCTSPDSCAVFEVSIPVFFGIDSVASQKINRNIELAFSMGDPDAMDKSLQQIADEFVRNYDDFTDEMNEFTQGWYYEGTSNVNVLNDTLISLALEESYYTGGAHGSGGKYFLNFDPRTGEMYQLDDFFMEGYELALNTAGEKVFRKERELAETDDLQENYFEFPDNKFRLNDNFGFSNKGITFYFNSYEIAPYAAGPTEIFIPFSEISSWLRKEPATAL